MKHDPYYFPRDQWSDIAKAMGESLRDRMNIRIYASKVQSRHSHGVIGCTRHHIAEVIKCVKDAVRWFLRIDRLIRAADYDKCWCFDWRSVESRIDYVERHNLRNGWPRAPWEFVTRPPEQQ